MHIEDITKIENNLAERGYKKIKTCKVKDHDDFEWYKAFRYKNGDLKYQIFFEFWDFTKYGGPDWGVSVTIMPESVRNDVGRRDLELSTDWLHKIDKVEVAAKKFYNLIIKLDSYECV